jgi:opacity protein-like surface antigen
MNKKVIKKNMGISKRIQSSILYKHSDIHPAKDICRFVLISCFLMLSNQGYSQIFSNKEIRKIETDIADSVVDVYPYVLPIWGSKAIEKGFDIPYSAGLSVQYFTSESDVIINNLKVGFNGGPMYDLDGIVRFDEARAKASSITFRPDVWLFPFLNVYGILGKSAASTDVGFGVFLPDSSNMESEILNASTIVEFNTTTFGLGLTPTIGIGGGFLALDMNVAWTDVPQLSRPARTFVFGPRLGKAFKLKKKNSNLAVWVGGFRVRLASETNGSLELSEVFPDNGAEIGQKIDDAIETVGDKQMEVDEWWNGLTPPQQNNPVNKAKYQAANAALTRAGEILYAADVALEQIVNSSVQYSMDKQVKDYWNFIIGSQYQLSKNLMLRAEYGFLGSRNQFIAGLQYRFRL